MKELGDERRWCCFHPREMVVGVCALCLNERLLVVAAAAKAKKQQSNYNFTPKIRGLPKIFALTNLLNTRSDNIKSQINFDTPSISSPSPEDSFISIKFEENGVASWDKGKISKISHDEMPSKKIKSVIEHAKPRGSLRWRRPIGHLFHLIKRKRSSKADACHVSTREKVKYGWIRILTKRRAKE